MNIPVFLVFLLVVGLAVKQISYILMYGSIFRSFRENIAKRASVPRRIFWGKVKELFSCNLCLTAHVAIWATGIIFIFLHIVKPHFLLNTFYIESELFLEILINLVSVFTLSMCVAGIAMGFWELLDYLPKKLNILEENMKEKNRILSLQGARREVNFESKELSIQDFTLNDFKKLVKKLKDECFHIECGVSRRECRKRIISNYLLKWYREKNADNMEIFMKISDNLNQALARYYKNKIYSGEAQGINYNMYFS